MLRYHFAATHRETFSIIILMRITGNVAEQPMNVLLPCQVSFLELRIGLYQRKRHDNGGGQNDEGEKGNNSLLTTPHSMKAVYNDLLFGRGGALNGVAWHVPKATPHTHIYIYIYMRL